MSPAEKVAECRARLDKAKAEWERAVDGVLASPGLDSARTRAEYACNRVIDAAMALYSAERAS